MLAATPLLLAALAASTALPSPAPGPQDEPASGIDGRFLLPSGEPAAGAKWTVHGWGANTQRKLEFGEPEDWEDPSGSLDDEGRLRARFESPQAYQFTLQIEFEDHVTARYRWSQIEPDEVKALGSVKFRPACRLEGTVVDAEGRPLTGKGWLVYAEETAKIEAQGWRPARERVAVDTKTAAFAVDGLPAGQIELKVYEQQIGWSRPHMVDVVADRTTRKDIVLAEAAEFEDRIVVTVFKGIYHSAPEPMGSHIWLVSADGTRRTASRIQGTSQSWAFDDVGPGTFRVEIDDPRYDAWSQEGVETNSEVRPRLSGSAALQLDVRDTTGDAVDLYQVDITFENVNFRPNTFRPVDGRSRLADGLLDGVVPASYTVKVSARGRIGIARADGLGPGETRSLRIELRESTVARGVVRYRDGEPAKGVLVRLVAPAEERDSPQSPIWGANTFGSSPQLARQEKKRTKTDRNGVFELVVELPASYLILAGDEGAPLSETAVFDTGAGPGPAAFEIAIDRGSRIAGQVLFPDGIEAQGRRITYVAVERPQGVPTFMRPVVLDEQGRFRLGPLAAGKVELFVESRGGGRSYRGHSLGTLELVDGESIERTFDYPGGAPARVMFDLTPTELGSVEVTLVATARGGTASRVTGPTPRLGPLVLESGTYDLWITGDGWLAHIADWQAGAGEERTDVLDLDLWTRRVRFVRSGRPVANATIQFASAPRDATGRSFETDGDGWAELRLGFGTYAFSIQSRDPELRSAMAAVEWPLGEGVVDIHFR